MEPLQIKITVGLDEATLGGLTALLGALVLASGKEVPGIAGTAEAPQAPASEAAPAAPARATRKKAPAKQEATETHEEPAPSAPAAEATPAPAAPAPAEVPGDMPEHLVSDDEMLAFIAKEKKTRPIEAIREVFNNFGITASTSCPMDRRPALMEAIKAIPSHA